MNNLIHCPLRGFFDGLVVRIPAFAAVAGFSPRQGTESLQAVGSESTLE